METFLAAQDEVRALEAAVKGSNLASAEMQRELQGAKALLQDVQVGTAWLLCITRVLQDRKRVKELNKLLDL